MDKSSSLGQFLKKYGSESKCLEAIKNLKYPNGIFCQKCQAITKFYQVKTRPLYECSCGYQISILRDTIFEGTKTSLFNWFYSIFVISNTRSGVSAKTLQRELGVAYNTAWRMFHCLRKLMADGSLDLLTGTVEIDETYVGGKGYNRGKIWWANWEERPKAIVWGAVQREGKVRTKIVPNTGLRTLTKVIKDNIAFGAFIMSDQLGSYKNLHKYGYAHANINHSKKYVFEDIYTQNIENFWSHPKRGITGVFRHVSPKYLQLYFNEFAFRYNNRKEPEKMFEILLNQSTLNN